MAGILQHVAHDQDYPVKMSNAGAKLVVVDFYAHWCRPCQAIGPVFEQLAAKYPNAVFLKVDCDQCPDTAQMNGITAMPTFIFFKNGTKIDRLSGGDAEALEGRIKKWYGSGDADEEDTPVKGHLDLAQFLQKSDCECLNESDDHPMEHALTSKGGYLESDCDEQLIIALAFNQKMKLHSLRIDAPKDKGPKTIKLFINQPRTLDFDKAEAMEPVQTIELTEEDLEAGNIVGLKYVKLQCVENINLFIRDNQTGEELTQIDYLAIIGSPLDTTNMQEFKRVAGKKGESH